MAKDKRRREDVSLPWGRDPLKDLLGGGPRRNPKNFDPRKDRDKPRKRRRRYYSPLKERPRCPACGEHKWIIVLDDYRYRDPFLVCGECPETFRMDMTPLDFQYAWRDDIPMPQEVRLKFTRRKSR